MTSKRKILIVDDDVSTAQILSSFLESSGYETEIAFDGHEALEKARSEHPDLMLLDIMLPVLNGYEVCKIIKAELALADIAVIFSTVKDDPDDIVTGLGLGANDYILKPFDLKVVLARVLLALRMRELHQNLRIENAELRDLTYTDELTGLRNKRYLHERLQEEADKAARYDLPLACVLIEADNYEEAKAGQRLDRAEDLLAEIAMTIRRNSRSFDTIARVAENRFAAVLFHASADDALAYGEKIRTGVSEKDFYWMPDNKTVSVTVGFAAYDAHCSPDYEEIMNNAEEALNEAIEHGRNTVMGRDYSSQTTPSELKTPAPVRLT